ncbi:GtrA family protein [Maricaulis sp. CAU 1757]
MSLIDKVAQSPLVRYLIVGGSVNLALFVFYLLVVRLGFIPEIATTLAFALGVVITYVLNKGWSFKSSDSHRYAAPRYVFSYLVGYVVQIGVLAVSYRVLPLPHEVAQLVAMVFAAGTIFVMLNFWVFRSRPAD